MRHEEVLYYPAIYTRLWHIFLLYYRINLIREMGIYLHTLCRPASKEQTHLISQLLR